VEHILEDIISAAIKECRHKSAPATNSLKRKIQDDNDDVIEVPSKIARTDEMTPLTIDKECDKSDVIDKGDVISEDDDDDASDDDDEMMASIPVINVDSVASSAATAAKPLSVSPDVINLDENEDDDVSAAVVNVHRRHPPVSQSPPNAAEKEATENNDVINSRNECSANVNSGDCSNEEQSQAKDSTVEKPTSTTSSKKDNLDLDDVLFVDMPSILMHANKAKDDHSKSSQQLEVIEVVDDEDGGDGTKSPPEIEVVDVVSSVPKGVTVQQEGDENTCKIFV